MSKGFWFSVFRPVNNRNYIGIKRYRILYLIRLLPVFVLLMIGVIFQPSRSWLIIIAIVIASMLLDYFTSGIGEKIWWNLIFKRFYSNQSDENYELMKAYEKNPTPDNMAKIQELKDKNNV